MKKTLLPLLMSLLSFFTVHAAQEVTEGVIDGNFVDEATMKGDLLQMLANFAQ